TVAFELARLGRARLVTPRATLGDRPGVHQRGTLARCLHRVEDVWLGRDLEVDGLERLAGGLRRLGRDGGQVLADELDRVPNLAERQNGVNSGGFAGRLDVERIESAVWPRRAQHDGVEHVGQADVEGVLGTAADPGVAVDARGCPPHDLQLRGQVPGAGL